MGKGWGSLGIWVRTVVRNNQKEKCYSARWAIRNTLVLTGPNVKHPGMGRSHGRTRNGRVSVEKHRKVSLVQESAFTEWSLHFTEDAQITTLQSILDNILHILTIWAFEEACFKIHVREWENLLSWAGWFTSSWGVPSWSSQVEALLVRRDKVSTLHTIQWL